MAERITLAGNLSGPAKTETLMGREYQVVPAVLVRSQVLNNNLGATYLPPDAITDSWAQAANMAPVVVGDHPRSRGVAVSARDTSVLNARGAGFLFRTRADGDALKADVFLDASRSSDVEGLADVLASVNAGGRVELSTGFPVAIEEQPGVHNGKAYNRVVRPVGFDHLAVFDGDDLKGACSVDDGCGLGANAESGGEAERPSVGALRKGLDTLAEAARRWGLFPDALADNESDDDRRERLNQAVAEEHGGMGDEVWLVDVFSEDGYLVFEVWDGPQAGYYRADYEIGEDDEITLGEPVEVRRVTRYEPVPSETEESSAGNTTRTTRGEAAMNREELIAQLSGGCPQKAERLGELDDDTLAVFGELVEDKGGEAATETKESEEVGGDQKESGRMAELAELVENLTAEVKGLKDATAPAVEEQARERDALVKELAGNERCPFGEDELASKTMDELGKLRAMARGTSYAGRGVQTEPVANKAPKYMPVKPYWQDKPVEPGKEN